MELRTPAMVITCIALLSTTAVASPPPAAIAAEERAVAAGRQGDWQRALSELDVASKIAPDWIELQYLIAGASIELGRELRARGTVADLRRAAELIRDAATRLNHFGGDYFGVQLTPIVAKYRGAALAIEDDALQLEVAERQIAQQRTDHDKAVASYRTERKWCFVGMVVGPSIALAGGAVWLEGDDPKILKVPLSFHLASWGVVGFLFSAGTLRDLRAPPPLIVVPTTSSHAAGISIVGGF